MVEGSVDENRLGDSDPDEGHRVLGGVTGEGAGCGLRPPRTEARGRDLSSAGSGILSGCSRAFPVRPRAWGCSGVK